MKSNISVVDYQVSMQTIISVGYCGGIIILQFGKISENYSESIYLRCAEAEE